MPSYYCQTYTHIEAETMEQAAKMFQSLIVKGDATISVTVCPHCESSNEEDEKGFYLNNLT